MRFTTFTDRAETCARACAIALGFSIPISVALDNVLLALILASWIASGGYREKLDLALHNQVAVAAFALFCLFAAGLIHSSGSPGDGLSTLGKYLDLAFVPIFVSLFRDERMRHYAWLAFAFALALTLILSCLTWAGVITNHWLVIGDRADAAVFKKYLTQSVMMAFGAFLFAQLARAALSARHRYGWSALATFAVVNVAWMSQGRTGQLILIALVLYFVHSVWRWRGTLGAAASIAVVIGALAMGNTGTGNRFSQAYDEWKNWQPEQAAQTSIGLRLEFYRNSLELVREHALFGTGTGSFPKVYADHVVGTAMAATANPHNEYLNIAVQLGVVGLLMMLFVFYSEGRLAAALPTAHERHLAYGLVITFVIGCLFNSMLMDHTEGLLFAWASGLLFAGLKSPANPRAPAR